MINSKLVSSTIISSLLIGNLAHALNPASEVGFEVPRGIVSQRITGIEAQPLVDANDWHLVEGPRLKGWEQLEEYQQEEERQRQAFEKAGGAWTLHPEARGARLQRMGRMATQAGSVAWDYAGPLVLPVAARVVSDIILSQVGPWFAEQTGKAGASVASRANSWWTGVDPTGLADKGIRTVAAATAKGEALRDLGTLTYYAETYGVPTLGKAARWLYSDAQRTAAAVSASKSTLSIENAPNDTNNSEELALAQLEKLGIVARRVAEEVAKATIGNLDEASEWHIATGPRLSSWSEITRFEKEEEMQEKAFQRVGGAGTLHPEAPGALRQKIARKAKQVGLITWKYAEPVVLPVATRIASNVILSQVGPLFVEQTGKAAASAASRANSWWTRFDPTGLVDKGIRMGTKTTAKGEALRHLGTLTSYAETYAVPALKTAYNATVTAAKGLQKGAQLAVTGTSKAYSWSKSWFSQSEQTL